MNMLRTAVGIVATLLMAGGYFASQFASLFGDPNSYIKALDASSVPALSLCLLLACFVLALVPAKEVKAP